MHGHGKYFGIALVVLGVLFLLRDLDIWSFWNISWWTALFLLVGIKGIIHTFMCKDGNCCNPVKKPMKAKK
jgi:hypothetical protein